MEKLQKIGFGGGCHWCTEAVFQFLKGVKRVEQGYISTSYDPGRFYEGVIVHFDAEEIDLEVLVQVHLKTHQSRKEHSLRSRYLSAIYSFNANQQTEIMKILAELNKKQSFITKAILIGDFKASRQEIRNYYLTDPERPFCKVHIEPKLELLKEQFSKHTK